LKAGCGGKAQFAFLRGSAHEDASRTSVSEPKIPWTDEERRATGILPVLEDGQDGHGTPPLAAVPQ